MKVHYRLKRSEVESPNLRPPSGRPETNHRIRQAVSHAIGKTGTLNWSTRELEKYLSQDEVQAAIRKLGDFLEHQSDR